MTVLWITIALLGLVGWVIYQFSSLVGLSNDVDEAWAQIDSQFVRRHELVARLLEQVNSDRLATARTAAMNAYTPSEKSKAEPALAAEIAALPVSDAEVARTLADIENYLRTAGEAYNTLVDELNARARGFPNGLLASLFGVELRERFQPEAR
jgi:LemA protein